MLSQTFHGRWFQWRAQSNTRGVHHEYVHNGRKGLERTLEFYVFSCDRREEVGGGLTHTLFSLLKFENTRDDLKCVNINIKCY